MRRDILVIYNKKKTEGFMWKFITFIFLRLFIIEVSKEMIGKLFEQMENPLLILFYFRLVGNK